MNLSVRLREREGPLARLKVPLTVPLIGLRLGVGATAGASEGVSLHAGGFFSGISWRVQAHPSSSSSSSALRVLAKTALGGSDGGNALRLAAEYDVRSRQTKVTVRFKPRLGALSLRHSHCTDCAHGGVAIKSPTPHNAPKPATQQDLRHIHMHGAETSSQGLVRAAPTPTTRPVGATGTATTTTPHVDSHTPSTSGSSGGLMQLATTGLNRTDCCLHLHNIVPLGDRAWFKIRWAVAMPTELLFGGPNSQTLARRAWVGLTKNAFVRLDKVSLVHMKDRRARDRAVGSAVRPSRKNIPQHGKRHWTLTTAHQRAPGPLRSVRKDLLPELKAVTLAQWLLESGRGNSRLSAHHCNYGGLKWRQEMAGLAIPIRRGYATDPHYVNKVIQQLPEARRLLGQV
eukprot:jgi/Chlat1/262/Chrsp1S03051